MDTLAIDNLLYKLDNYQESDKLNTIIVNVSNVVLSLDKGSLRWKEYTQTGKVLVEEGHGTQSFMSRVKYHRSSSAKRKKIKAIEWKAKVQDKIRDKKYNKKIKSNILFKLKEAEKLYKDGNSMSKSARLLEVEYETLKQFIQTGNFEV